MTNVREALDAILRVDFMQTTAVENSTMGAFLERAANEISKREVDVASREREVSRRESNVQLREDQVEANIKSLATSRRIMRVLEQPRRQPRWSFAFWKRPAI